MRVSSIITPFRWYNDFFEQDRFTHDCQQLCPFELITDKTRLLPFQIMRPKSMLGISKFWIRESCTDYYKPTLSKNDSLFIYDTGVSWDLSAQFAITNSQLKATFTTGPSGQLQNANAFVPTKKYSIKIIVTEISQVPGSTITITVKDGSSTTLGTISNPGTFIYNITSITDTLNIDTTSTDSSNYIIFEEISIYEIIGYNGSIGDINIDPSAIFVCNAGDTDYFTHVGPPLGTPLKCGEYYCVIQMEDGTMYFSEVFKVKEFIPSQSPYVLLEWSNTCDILDVVFSAFTYKNWLYIDGPISKPEYPIKEEGEEDGDHNLNITFQKWEKQRMLTVAKAPEFITDALTAIRLHDTISYTYPLRKDQFKVASAESIRTTEDTLTSVFGDCATTVELKMALNDRIVDTACCNTIGACECNECAYTVEDINIYDVSYGFALSFGEAKPAGIYQYISGVWTLITIPVGTFVCTTAFGQLWQYAPSNPFQINGWIAPNTWVNCAYVSGTTWNVKGIILEGTFGLVEYSTNGGSTWIQATPKITAGQFAAGVNVSFSPIPCCGPFIVKITSYDLSGCTYGSATYNDLAPADTCC